MLVGASPASAHTGFESSTPAALAIVNEPVEFVTISFTGPATPVGDGFIALNASGVLQEPVSISTPDDLVFTIRFDPPLAGGEVGVRWNVQAVDAHPIEGAFSFTVTAPPPAAVPDSSDSATTPATTAAESDIATQDPATSMGSVPTGPDAEAASTVEVDDGNAGGGSAAPALTLDEFLAPDEAGVADTIAFVGRILGLLGTTLALGAVAFGLGTLRGSRAEVRTLLVASAVAAVALTAGGVIEYLGVSGLSDESIWSAWSTSAGFATVLRVVGGLGLVAGLRTSLRLGEVAPVRAARLVSVGTVDDPTAGPDRAEEAEEFSWTPSGSAWLAGVGVLAVLLSFWFDGHTVSRGFRPLHALVNTVHVAAGSVWVGGVVALCAIGWRRHRRGSHARVAELVVRFSRVATLALGPVMLAGVVMGFIVLESFGDLTATEWGLTLLLKMAVVAVAVSIGAYNHFRLVPALDAEHGSDPRASQLRLILTAEAIVLVAVVIVTASLVAAATT